MGAAWQKLFSPAQNPGYCRVHRHGSLLYHEIHKDDIKDADEGDIFMESFAFSYRMQCYGLKPLEKQSRLKPGMFEGFQTWGPVQELERRKK